MNKLLTASLLVLLALSAAHATPTTTTYDWTLSNSSVGNGSGTFTAVNTTSTTNSFTGHLVTGITGTMNGGAITGLIAPGDDGYLGNAENDNLLAAGSAPLVSPGGIAFTTASDSFCIFYDAPSYGSANSDGGGNGVGFTVTTAPEPSSLALSALGGIGGLMALRRRK